MEKLQLISVLGGGRDKQTGMLIESSIARLNAAARTFHNQPNQQILVMGGTLKSYSEENGRFNTPGAKLREEYLISTHQVPRSLIIVQPIDARDTISEALITRDVVGKHQPSNVQIVTSITHLRRAMEIFEMVFKPIEPPVKITPISDPPADQLNPNQELALMELTHNYFHSHPLPDKYPGWEDWHKENQTFYQEQREIHAQFKAKGTASKGAYASIHD